MAQAVKVVMSQHRFLLCLTLISGCFFQIDGASVSCLVRGIRHMGLASSVVRTQPNIYLDCVKKFFYVAR